MSYIIGGGTGFVGSALAQLLESQGLRAIIVSRSKRQRPPDSSGLTSILTWDELESRGLDDVTGVVNLAGANLMDPKQRWTPEYKRDVYHSRIHTTKTLVRLINEAKIKPKVFVSSSAIASGYYPPSDLREYNEYYVAGRDSADFFSKLCIDWEKAAELPAKSTTRHCIVRIGVVLGRTGGMIQNLITPFYAGLGGRVGRGTQPLSWVHLDDVTGLIHHLLTTEDEHVKGVFNAVAPEAATNQQFASAFAKALNRPAIFPVPAFVMRFMLGGERASVVLDGQKVYPKRTLDDAGYRFKYATLQEACNEFARLQLTAEEKSRTIK